MLGATVLRRSKFLCRFCMCEVRFLLDDDTDDYCSGSAAFTVLKDAQGTPRLEPHSESLSVYGLTVSTTDSPTDIPCSSS